MDRIKTELSPSGISASLFLTELYDILRRIFRTNELDTSYLGHSIVMIEPITGFEELEWRLRICRPAFQDFQRLLPRYHVRSELNRQLHKLRWWNPDELLVIDLKWNRIGQDALAELLIQLDDGVADTVRVLFFEHSPDPSVPTLWIHGAMRADEAFGSLQHAIYSGRSIIVQERAD